MQKKYSNKSSNDRRYKLYLMSSDNKMLTAKELISLLAEIPHAALENKKEDLKYGKRRCESSKRVIY